MYFYVLRNTVLLMHGDFLSDVFHVICVNFQDMSVESILQLSRNFLLIEWFSNRTSSPGKWTGFAVNQGDWILSVLHVCTQPKIFSMQDLSFYELESHNMLQQSLVSSTCVH